MAEKTEALTAILEDIQDQAGLVTDQIHSEVQQLQDEEIHFFTESLHKMCIRDRRKRCRSTRRSPTA